jgi:glycine/D-amino acid oxidase-like deaminating enzyme/nitrite reductase/ring-hydroxylating ferredoxin subunit
MARANAFAGGRMVARTYVFSDTLMSLPLDQPGAFSEASVSIWRTARTPLEYPALTRDIVVEVCVIGAGIAGLSVAYELVRSGVGVAVLDDNAIGGGETSQTSAHLASALDDRFHELERLHGIDGARLAYASHAAAIDRIEEIARDEAIECDLRRVDGFLFTGAHSDPDELQKEFEAARRAGVLGIEWLERVPGLATGLGPCVRFPRQARFHPLKYVEALARAIKRRGGQLFTGTHVHDVHGDWPLRVQAATGASVYAKAIVLATNAPLNDTVAIAAKQEPNRTFVIALDLPKDVSLPALYWDTADPYHYVRAARVEGSEQRVLLVGGEDHRVGEYDDAEQRFGALEHWARSLVPRLAARRNAWSGQIMEPIDGLAFIGRSPSTGDMPVFIATGDSGNGLTHGVIAGLLIRDLILERNNGWAPLYDPARKNVKSIKRFVSHNARVARHLAEHLSGGEVKSLAQIPPNSGAVVRRGLHKLAVYRDANGNLSACSANCTHLDGVLHWNGEEQSWDCPLHGSRFSPNGQVLNGPAMKPLQPVSIDEEAHDE